jgi:hypothetical protein
MLINCFTVTRSHKHNDRDHVGLADGTAAAEEHLPRYFAKAGHTDSDPKKVKKEGGGKGNWSAMTTVLLLCKRKLILARGRSGDEMQDYGYNFTNARRRSNSSSQVIADFKTKFEGVENDPVFQEELHGPNDIADDEGHVDLHKAETSDSTSSASVEEEDHVKKA